MSTGRPDAHQRAADLRTLTEARVQYERQRPLPSWLLSRGRRRGLAMIPAGVFALGVIAATLAESTAGVLLLLLLALIAATGTVLLRRATQMLDAAPQGLLDEREVAQRNQAYRRAHGLTLAVVCVIWLLAVVDDLLMPGFTAAPVISGIGWVYVTFAALLTISMLPAAALAWGWNAPVAHPDDEN